MTIAGSYITGRKIAGCKIEDRNVASINTVGRNTTGKNIAGRNFANINITSSKIASINVTGRNLASINIAGRNTAGRNIAGRNIAGRNIAGRNTAGRNIAGRNPASGKIVGFIEQPSKDSEMRDSFHDRDYCISLRRRMGINLQTSLLLVLLLVLVMTGPVSCGWSRPLRHVIPAPTPPRPTLPPVFDTKVATNVTVTADKTALLSCVVHNLGNNSVSWIRHRDLHILSVGPVTYTTDDRFKVISQADAGDWALRLRYARPRDTGFYDCQVSSTPLERLSFHLTVIEPKATILRSPEMHVGVGSLINLTCIVPYSPEPPEYLHWYHKERMVRADGTRVFIQTVLGERSQSQLEVRNAQRTDSGSYTCSPSHSVEQSVIVHVLTAGEYPAAMQGVSSVTRAGHWRLLWLMTSPLFIIVTFTTTPYFYM